MRAAITVIGGLLCVLMVSACASVSGAPAVGDTQAMAGRGVLLVPQLVGGYAGWCMAAGEECADPATMTGPVVAETCSGRNGETIDVYVLTRDNVVAVSIDHGRSVRTVRNATLMGGMREAAIEVLRQHGKPSPCPRVTAIGSHGKRLTSGAAKRASLPLDVMLPYARHWRRPERSRAGGGCELAPYKRLPQNVTLFSGSVVTKIEPVSGLLGDAMLACIGMHYFYMDEHSIWVAVLLDAKHPGAVPPSLPEMKPLTGHPGIFETPGVVGERVARRVAGAWLVAEESDGIGLGVPMELLSDLRATIRWPT